MSIQIKTVVPVIVAMVLLVAFIFVFVSIHVTSLANSLAEAREQSVAENARNHLRGLETQSAIISHSISTNPHFIDIYTARDYDAIRAFFNAQKALFGVESILLTDAYATVLFRSHDPARYGDDASRSAGISYALQGGSLSLYVSNESFKIGLSSVAPILDAQGVVIGSLVVSYDLSREYYVNYFSNTFDAEVAFFAGSHMVTTSMQALGNAQTADYISPDADMEEALNTVLTYNSTISRRMIFACGGDFNVLFHPLSGRVDEVVGIFFIGFSRAEVNEEIARMQTIIILAILVGMVLAGTFLVFMITRFTKPLWMLTRQVLDINEGEIVELYGTHRKDEVGALSRNIGQMRSKLVALVQNAQAASEAKSHFLSNMSHEIRTPLNAINGMVAIGTSHPTAHNKQYALDKIGLASAHLLGVINDVLDIAKVEANKFTLNPVAFSFKRSISHVVEVIRYRMDEKMLNLIIEADPSLPRYVVGDAQRYMQVLTNILTNAVKFTPEQGVIRLSVSLAEKRTDTCTILTEITDTGIGMTEEQQARVFDLFEQAEPGTYRNYGGTGLGLSISKQIVAMMNGEIWVNSTPGVGTTFTFSSVFGYANDDMHVQLEEAVVANFNEAVFEGKVILLAEDIEINCEIVRALLADTKIIIDCAEDGNVAVEKYKAAPGRYDLVFMDVQMPVMNGYEATRQIRAAQPPGVYVPIIAMTANVFKDEVEKCLEAGMDDHIGKPIDRAVVIEKLCRWLN